MSKGTETVRQLYKACRQNMVICPDRTGWITDTMQHLLTAPSVIQVVI